MAYSLATNGDHDLRFMDRHDSGRRLEQSLLGAVLIAGSWRDAEADRLIDRALGLLTPEDFNAHGHGKAWEIIGRLRAAGDVVNPITVYHEAVQVDWSDEIVDDLYLSDCMVADSFPGDIPYLAIRIKRLALGRELVDATGSSDIERITAISREMATLTPAAGEEIPGMGELLSSYWDVMDAGAERPVHWGIPGLDRLTGGMLPGQLVVVGARPSVGKSALAISVAHNAARGGRPVGLVSLEMGEHEIVQRLLAIKTGLSTQEVRRRDAFDTVTSAMGPLSELPLYAVSPSSNLTEVIARARTLHEQRKIDLLIIDYLQLMEVGGRSDNRVQELSKITRALKRLAGELAIPVLALAQLNRGAEGHEYPRLSDLKDSGSIEQDADIALLLHRKDDDPAVATDLLICQVAKHRNGPTGNVNLRLIRKTTEVVEEAT